MNLRVSPWMMGGWAVALVLLMPRLGWAVYFPLGPSSDDWGMKYAVEVSEANDDSLNVTFKLTDGGRLSPIYSATVVAFSKPHSDGGRSYLVQEPLELKANQAGEYSAQVRIPKKHAAIAQIRILTLTVNGRRQTAGAAYYDIPLKKHVNQPAASASSNSPPSVAKKPAKAR